MLEVKNLIFSYDELNNVLKGASFKLETGKVYCLLGVNGSGKTTLFNCLTGFLKSNINLDEKFINENILYIQDEMSFYSDLRGFEFIELILNLKGILLDKKLYNELLESLQMKDYVKKLISTYSLGTKQKLVLILGFLLEYKYIFMDEPFGAIDFIAAEVVMEFLKKYANRNNAIVISTHLIDIAHELADDILFLNEGKITTIKNTFESTNDIKKWIKKEVL